MIIPGVITSGTVARPRATDLDRSAATRLNARMALAITPAKIANATRRFAGRRAPTEAATMNPIKAFPASSPNKHSISLGLIEHHSPWAGITQMQSKARIVLRFLTDSGRKPATAADGANQREISNDRRLN